MGGNQNETLFQLSRDSYLGLVGYCDFHSNLFAFCAKLKGKPMKTFTIKYLPKAGKPDLIVEAYSFKEAIEKYKDNLSGANLFRADLSWADLSWADLSRANLSGADLSGANLSGANLPKANLSWANLSGANLFRADLSWAKNIPDKARQLTLIAPEGSIIGWKKCHSNVIVKLLIPETAKRSNATGRKCRAEFVQVLEVIGGSKGITCTHGPHTEYTVGSIVRADKWDDNRWNECSNGIHFFLTREEAEAY